MQWRDEKKKKAIEQPLTSASPYALEAATIELMLLSPWPAHCTEVSNELEKRKNAVHILIYQELTFSPITSFFCCCIQLQQCGLHTSSSRTIWCRLFVLFYSVEKWVIKMRGYVKRCERNNKKKKRKGSKWPIDFRQTSFSPKRNWKKKCKTLSLAFLGEAIATSKTERGAHTDTHTQAQHFGKHTTDNTDKSSAIAS